MQKDETTSLLDVLSKTRWTRKDDKIKVGVCLKSEWGEKYKASWKRLGQISPDYDEDDSERVWQSIDGKLMTNGTKVLESMAREDDPIGYRMHRARHIHPMVLENWDQKDRGLAVIAHHVMKHMLKKCGERDVYIFNEDECRWIKGLERHARIPMSYQLEGALRDVMTYYSAKGASDQLDEKQLQVRERIAYVQRTSGMNNVITNLSDLIQDDTFEQNLDSTPHLIGVKNGVVDLRSGKLRKRMPEDMIFSLCDVEYDECLDTSLISDTVLAAMADDESMADFLQMLLGYGITGEICEEVFVIFTGTGRNCKGVITQLLQKLMGGLFVDMNPATICERQVSNIDAEKGKLLGARIALFSELAPGEKLKASEVQLLSGGDTIPARPLYHKPMTIVPRHMCILSTNHLPEINPVLPAIVERILCVDFPVTFTDLLPGEEPSRFRRQADKTLKERLEANKSSVFTWLVQGAKKWYAAGKGSLKRLAPASVKEAGRQYFFEQDRLAQFLQERCVIATESKVATKVFLAAYNQWNDDGRACTSKEMAKTMKLKGFEKKVSKIEGVSTNSYIGVDVLPLPLMIDDQV